MEKVFSWKIVEIEIDKYDDTLHCLPFLLLFSLVGSSSSVVPTVSSAPTKCSSPTPTISSLEMSKPDVLMAFSGEKVREDSKEKSDLHLF